MTTQFLRLTCSLSSVLSLLGACGVGQDPHSPFPPMSWNRRSPVLSSAVDKMVIHRFTDVCLLWGNLAVGGWGFAALAAAGVQAHQVSMLSRPWLMCGYDCSVSLAPWGASMGGMGMGVPPAPVLAPSLSVNDSAPPFPIEPAQASRGSPRPLSLACHPHRQLARTAVPGSASEQELVRGVGDVQYVFFSPF